MGNKEIWARTDFSETEVFWDAVDAINIIRRAPAGWMDPVDGLGIIDGAHDAWCANVLALQDCIQDEQLTSPQIQRLGRGLCLVARQLLPVSRRPGAKRTLRSGSLLEILGVSLPCGRRLKSRNISGPTLQVGNRLASAFAANLRRTPDVTVVGGFGLLAAYAKFIDEIADRIGQLVTSEPMPASFWFNNSSAITKSVLCRVPSCTRGRPRFRAQRMYRPYDVFAALCAGSGLLHLAGRLGKLCASPKTVQGAARSTVPTVGGERAQVPGNWVPGQGVPLGLEKEFFQWRRGCVIDGYEGNFQDFLLSATA